MDIEMRRVGKCPSFAALALLVLASLLTACGSSSRAGNIQRKDLFAVGYGMSENQIDFSAQGRDGIDLTMGKGIFHLLDGGSRKVMRLSSYGDLLALFFDPSISPLPGIVKPLSLSDGDASGDEGPTVAGRYAVPVTFTQPSRIAVGLDQTIYIADKVAEASFRIYDVHLASYCDRIIRRFGSMGVEKAYIGQEGPGGSPFPAIMSMEVFSDDSLGVLSATESAFLVHHFDRAGNLLSSLHIGRETLPVPSELSGFEGNARVDAKTEGAWNSTRIHANLDSMMMASEGASFRLILKLDFYREYYDSASLAISLNEYAGSWIFAMDGWTGHIENSLPIAPASAEGPSPELIGLNSRLYYLLYPATEDDTSWEVRLMNLDGKVQSRVRIEAPEGTREMITIKVSEEGLVYALLKMDENVQVSLWDVE